MEDELFKRYIIYKGESTIDHDVPICKMTYCLKKAKADCMKCGTATCSDHVCKCIAQHICHWCRLIDWILHEKG